MSCDPLAKNPKLLSNREEKSYVTLPWWQNFWMTTIGSFSNDDVDGNENGKKAIGLD